MREKTCCFTGHRELPFLARRRIAAKLEKAVVAQIDRGIRFFGAGGALGFDTLAAQTVLKLKKEYPDIKLILVLPCLTQARGWPAEDVEEYERIKPKRHLVDNSSVCICYLTKKDGGTAYTVNYARERGLEIVNVAGG